MIGKFRKESYDLNKPIQKVLEEMDVYGPDTDEFETQLKNLERLTKLQRKTPKRQVSPDTLVQVGGTLVGILIIVMFEKTDVMTSKAFGFNIKKNP